MRCNISPLGTLLFNLVAVALGLKLDHARPDSVVLLGCLDLLTICYHRLQNFSVISLSVEDEKFTPTKVCLSHELWPSSCVCGVPFQPDIDAVIELEPVAKCVPVGIITPYTRHIANVHEVFYKLIPLTGSDLVEQGIMCTFG